MVAGRRTSECPVRANGKTRGFFLRQVSPSAVRALEAVGTRVVLGRGQVVFGPDRPLDHIYFLDEGIVAIVAETGGDRFTGCALIGSEGYLLPAAVLGVYRVPNRCQVIVVPLGSLSGVQERESALHGLLLKFAYVLITQLISTTHSQSNDPIFARLSRFILMLHDRSPSDDIRIRHSDCAAFLGVRRSSVTEAMQRLEGGGMVTNDRGFVSVSNRSALMKGSALLRQARRRVQQDDREVLLTRVGGPVDHSSSRTTWKPSSILDRRRSCAAHADAEALLGAPVQILGETIINVVGSDPASQH